MKKSELVAIIRECLEEVNVDKSRKKAGMKSTKAQSGVNPGAKKVKALDQAIMSKNQTSTKIKNVGHATRRIKKRGGDPLMGK